MLQRAASNAYSWWWASHIRTKQSKWLEQNLQDMEERVGYTLKIINEEGDTFSQRAEMYYRKRPELVSFVEEAFRSYRALAERYDHLSKDFQRANRTIASAFPDQVPIALDDDDYYDNDDDDVRGYAKNPQNHMEEEVKACVPSVPEMPKRDFRSPSMLLLRKGTLRRNSSSVNKAVLWKSSGLSKSEASEEIDRLQKGILALQTEKEFVKSAYIEGYEKYCKIEDEIDEMQTRVCDLQNEFSTQIMIDDSEARTLMAGTAIKSCKESLAKLEEKQKQSEEVAKFAKGRVKEALEKFEALKKEFLSDQSNHMKTHAEESESGSAESGLESSGENIKQYLEVDLNVTQFVEKIDELVGNVVTLETAASSQTALVNNLRSETEELHGRIRGLEEEKETLISDSEDMNKRVGTLEGELSRIKSLCLRFEEENKNIRMNFAVLSCNADHLSGNLYSVKMDEDMRVTDLDTVLDETTEEMDSIVDAQRKVEINDKKNHRNSLGESIKTVVETEKTLERAQGEKSKTIVETDGTAELRHEEKSKRKVSSERTSISLETELEESSTEEDEDQHRLRQALTDRSADREKDLLDEYTSVVKNYQEVKRKLGDVEKKNRDGFFELALQVRELKNAVNYRDVEIENLRDKLYTVENGSRQIERNHSESHYLIIEGQQESKSQLTSSPLSSFPSPGLQEHHGPNKHAVKPKNNGAKPKQDAENPKQISAVQRKIREHIDTLLEENLEFWLTFAASVHQIHKFQTSVQDLELELRKMNEAKKQQGNERSQTNSSDVRALYRHLREIKTEMQLWLENNEVLKDEVQTRYSSLCGIQDEISKLTCHRRKGGKMKLNECQAAKFHGEVLNMKQESNRVLNELQRSLDCVRMLKVAVEKTLAILEDDLGISATKSAGSQAQPVSGSTSRPRIPLRSFLFGVKLKKQKQHKSSMLSCVNPSLQKQCSYIVPIEKSEVPE